MWTIPSVPRVLWLGGPESQTSPTFQICCGSSAFGLRFSRRGGKVGSSFRSAPRRWSGPFFAAMPLLRSSKPPLGRFKLRLPRVPLRTRGGFALNGYSPLTPSETGAPWRYLADGQAAWSEVFAPERLALPHPIGRASWRVHTPEGAAQTSFPSLRWVTRWWSSFRSMLSLVMSYLAGRLVRFCRRALTTRVVRL